MKPESAVNRKVVLRAVTLAFGLVVSFESATSLDAQTGHGVPLAPKDIVSLNYLGSSDRQFSPDGKWVAYAVTSRHAKDTRETPDAYYLRTGVPEEGLGSDVRVVNTDSHIERNLTERLGNSWLPVWSPDGRFLAFQSTRDGGDEAKLWVWDLKEDRLRKVSNAPVRSGYFMEWTPDSLGIVLGLAPVGRASTSASNPEGHEHSQSFGSTAVVYLPQSAAQDQPSSDPLDERAKERDLALVRVSDGNVRILLRDERIGMFHVFLDGSRVAYSSPQRFDGAGSQQVLHRLSAVRIADGQKEVFAANLRLDLAGNFSVAPDGAKIAFRTTGADGVFDLWVLETASKTIRNVSNFGTSNSGIPIAKRHRWYFATTLFWNAESRAFYSITDGNLWRSSLERGETVEMAKIPGRMIRQLVGRDASRIAEFATGDSTIVIARDEERKQDGFYRVDLRTGAVSKLLERGECYTCDAGPRGHLAAVSSDGKSVIYSSQDTEHPSELWFTDAAFHNPSRLTDLNPQLDKYTMGQARLIDWLDCDGRRLRGAVILPAGYQVGKRYPLIVLVYGGATASDSLRKFGGYESGVSYLNMQLFATRGYAVLMPDAPQRMGTPMLDLAKTVLPGVNRMIELGIADPDRIGVLGHSYGGYSVLSLLVETNRFKAATALDGMANLVSLYGEMDKNGIAFGTSAETGQELVGGHPWSERERYIENSPFFYLDRIETPVLLVHGAQDTTFAAFLSDEVFVALRRLGKLVEYARYDGEDHIFTTEENQRDVCERMLRWFDGYLQSGH